MCLIGFSFSPRSDRCLLLAANRDEFHARPARPMAWWDQPKLLAGRDEQAGGTWLAVARDGRWAAVTNVRDPSADSGSKSRGELPVRFFESERSPENYASQIHSVRHQYGPFNLLVGTRDSLWYVSSDADPFAVAPGVHALSNGSLDAPWPKSRRLAAGLTAFDQNAADPKTLLTLLGDPSQAAVDELPDTGVGETMEQFLSSTFIRSERYGTRCSTVLSLGNDCLALERRFDSEGRTLGQLSYAWSGN